MADYNARLTTNLGVGEQQVVGDPSNLTLFTQAIAVGRDGAQPALVAIFNTTDVSITVQAALVDANANYVAVTTVAAASAIYFQTIGYFLRATYASIPTLGQITFAR